MKTLASEYPVVELCQALGLSRSGYYNWLKRPESRRAKANREVLDKITVPHEENRRCYGSPRMTHALRRQGLRIGKNRVARLMRTQGIRAKSKRAFRPRTTDSRHAERIAPNRLKELPGLNRPDQAWVVDITYIWTAAGWIYLAAVMDLYSRRIVGWALESSLETSLVTEALSRAQKERRPAPGLLHHSDRGSQYASSAYRALLAHFKIIASMSGLAHCYDNAAMESFWSSLKNELVHHEPFSNIDQARLAIFDYIELFYNRKRLHSALGYQSPVEFENQIVYKNNSLAPLSSFSGEVQPNNLTTFVAPHSGSSAPLSCRLQAAGQFSLSKPSNKDKDKDNLRYKRGGANRTRHTPWMLVVGSTLQKRPTVAKRHRKLASHEVAGNSAYPFASWRDEGNLQLFRCPFRTKPSCLPYQPRCGWLISLVAPRPRTLATNRAGSSMLDVFPARIANMSLTTDTQAPLPQASKIHSRLV